MTSVVLAGDGQRDLTFEVEMLLSADDHPAGQAMLRARQSRCGVAAREDQVLDDLLAARRQGGRPRR